MKVKLLFVASIAALIALSVPLFAQAGSSKAARISRTHRLTVTRGVSPAQALAAAKVPGAVYVKPGSTRAEGTSGTTFVQIAPGLTLRQAVGLDPIPAATMARLRRLAGYTTGRVAATAWAGCSTHSWLQTFGNYPFNVSITDHTTWCAKGGVITSKSTNATQTGSTFCTIGTMKYPVVVGGIGKLNLDWQDWGTWFCTWFPGQTKQATDWVEMHVDANGPNDYSVVATHTDPGPA